jgi:omega-hydroxy-beta-dihydromenaquinone-9 sulfotransferase
MAKNPLFSARIESLLETFPDARILYLVRDPQEMLPSTISMFAYLWGLFSAQPEKYPHCDVILAWTKYWYDHPLEVIDCDRSGRCLIMKYDDLMRSPDTEIQRIYDRFGYSESKELQAILSDAVKSARSHVSEHRYSLEEMGLDRERLQHEFAQILARFGYSIDSTEQKNAILIS